MNNIIVFKRMAKTIYDGSDMAWRWSGVACKNNSGEMEMKPNRYTIRTVEDFFSIPLDRLEPFMLDFIEFLVIGFSTLPDDALRMDRSFFTWIDDGDVGLSEVEIVQADDTTPPPASPPVHSPPRRR